jgi:hypothetical protein
VKGFESFDRMVEGIEISRGGVMVVTMPLEGPIVDSLESAVFDLILYGVFLVERLNLESDLFQGCVAFACGDLVTRILRRRAVHRSKLSKGYGARFAGILALTPFWAQRLF